MGLVALLLWRLRDRLTNGLLFALYLLLAGTERFLVEFIRRNDDVALGLTQAQLISLAMMMAGGDLAPARPARRAPRPELREQRHSEESDQGEDSADESSAPPPRPNGAGRRRAG